MKYKELRQAVGQCNESADPASNAPTTAEGTHPPYTEEDRQVLLREINRLQRLEERVRHWGRRGGDGCTRSAAEGAIDLLERSRVMDS